MDYLTIALAKGRLGKEAYEILKELQLANAIDLDSRKLIYVDEDKKLRYIYVKPSDVITYVEKGVADLGIVGRDTILEEEGDVYEILDLDIGKCKFSIAGIKGQEDYKKDEVLRVATKYPNVTKKYFEKMQQKIDIIKLNGSVELGPLVGLSRVIVDIVQTGNTLRANGLEVYEDICAINGKMIANRVSYRFKMKQIQKIIRAIEGERGEIL